MLTWIDSFGYAATLLSCIILLPQIQKIYVSESADDVSYGMIVLMLLSRVMWYIHGWIKKDIPILLSTFITIILTIILLVLKHKYTGKGKK